MIRKRFPGSRVARLVGWTAVAVAWVGAGILRMAGADVGADTAPEPTPVPVPAERATAPASTAPVPALPAGGLTVIRYTPSAPPEPKVVTRVVEKRVVQSAPAPAAAPRPSSSGS